MNLIFLDYILSRMGFVLTWRKWVKAIVYSSRMSLLVNDSPIVEFQIEKGLKQRDLLV